MAEIDEDVADLISEYGKLVTEKSNPEQLMIAFKRYFYAEIGRDPSLKEKNYFMRQVNSTESADSKQNPSFSSSFTSKVINQYIFGEVLGKGGFGEVYRVVKAGKEYAIKRIDESKANTEMEQIFADSIGARLNSKFLVRYYEKFRYNRELFIVMELCAKGDLRKLIDKLREIHAVLQPERFAKILIQLLLGLDVLHRNKILHRDIKPENTFTDDEDNIKLGDFGCSKELDTTSMKAHTVIGTPVYESAEVIRGEDYDSSADMWALGVMLYELLMHERPFDHPNKFQLQQLIFVGNYKPIPRSRAQEEVVKIVDALLCKNPQNRPTASKLLQSDFVQQQAHHLDLLKYFPNFPSPVIPRYAFNVKCKGDKCFYGKINKDLRKVCGRDNDIEVYLSEGENTKTIVSKKDVIAFEFGAYSGLSIYSFFLYGCISLTSPPTIPDSVTSIGDYFMSECTSLTSPPTIPDSVTSIGEFFMKGCTSLTSPPTISSSMTIGKYFLSGVEFKKSGICVIS